MNMYTSTISIGRIHLNVEYSYEPPIPAVLDRAPEDCYEEEPARIDITSIKLRADPVDISEILSESTIKDIMSSIMKIRGKDND